MSTSSVLDRFVLHSGRMVFSNRSPNSSKIIAKAIASINNDTEEIKIDMVMLGLCLLYELKERTSNNYGIPFKLVDKLFTIYELNTKDRIALTMSSEVAQLIAKEIYDEK